MLQGHPLEGWKSRGNCAYQISCPGKVGSATYVSSGMSGSRRKIPAPNSFTSLEHVRPRGIQFSNLCLASRRVSPSFCSNCGRRKSTKSSFRDLLAPLGVSVVFCLFLSLLGRGRLCRFFDSCSFKPCMFARYNRRQRSGK